MTVGSILLESFLGPLAPEHPSEFVVGLLMAIFVAVGVTKFVVPKFEELYRQRADQIEGGINRAQKAEADAAALKRDFEKRLADSRNEAADIRTEAKEQAAQIIAQAKEEANRECERMISQARDQIAAHQREAFTQLKSDVGSLAVQLASKIVAERLDNDEAIDRSVDRFLDELDSDPSRLDSVGIEKR